MHRLVVVDGVGLQTRDLDMVVVCSRGLVRDRDVRDSHLVQAVGMFAVADGRMRQLGVRVPADRHPSVPSIRQADLHGGSLVIGAHFMRHAVDRGREDGRGSEPGRNE